MALSQPRVIGLVDYSDALRLSLILLRATYHFDEIVGRPSADEETGDGDEGDWSKLHFYGDRLIL